MPEAGKNKYLHNGKEFNEDYGANLYEYGARWYDPAVGRFTGVDAAGKPIYSYTQNGVVKGAGYMNMTPAEMITKYGLK